jgi:hypothetical protein
MSEFDKLKDEGEQYAKDHPEQVHTAEHDAEHAVESKFGIGGDQGQGAQGNQQQGQGNQQGQDGQQDPQGQSGDGGQGTSQGQQSQ